MARCLRLIVPFVLLVCSGLTVHAQELADYDYENLTFRGIGFDYGYIWPSKVESTSMYSLRLDLGYLGPAVRLVPGISYWTSDFKREELERLADRLNSLPPLQDDSVVITGTDLGTIKWSDLSLSVDAHVVWTIPLDIITFIGVGGSLHALNGRGDVIGNTFIEDLLDSTTAGVAFMGGVEYQIGPRLRLYSEVRYTLVTDVRYVGGRIGAALMLPQRAVTTSESGR